MSNPDTGFEQAKKRMDVVQAKIRRDLKFRRGVYWIMFTLNMWWGVGDLFQGDWIFGGFSLFAVALCASGIHDVDDILKQKFIERE